MVMEIQAGAKERKWIGGVGWFFWGEWMGIKTAGETERPSGVWQRIHYMGPNCESVLDQCKVM